MTVSELEEKGLAGQYHPAALRSKTFDVEEHLHRQRLRRRFILSWLTVGNFVIAGAIAGWLAAARFDVPVWLITAAIGALLSSSIASTVQLYHQHLRIRDSELRLRKLRQLAREYLLEEAEDAAKDETVDDGDTLLLIHKRYREDVPEVVENFRRDSNRYRRTGNYFQNIIIVGSLLASSATTASVYFAPARFLAVGISLLVATAAGFIAYYKYRERSFNLQQAADAIERNYYSVELRAGKFSAAVDEKAAYRLFVNEVEYLRDEQSKREQQLEQPAEVKHNQNG